MKQVRYDFTGRDAIVSRLSHIVELKETIDVLEDGVRLVLTSTRKNLLKELLDAAEVSLRTSLRIHLAEESQERVVPPSTEGE